jgi:hypothetical protein
MADRVTLPDGGRVREHVSRGELREAAVAIRELFTSSPDIVSSATLQLGRLADLEKRQDLGVIAQQDLVAERQQIALAILRLLDRIETRLGNSGQGYAPPARPTLTKILFVASNPEDVTQLALDEEIRSISARIREAKFRDSLDLKSAWATRPNDLLRELNEHQPSIVHFSGHGSRAGELLLMNDARQVQRVNPRALTDLFTTLKDNIRLVVLNACYSKVQGKAIAKVIDCVVGMNTAIGDKAAITFAAAFYSALGFGRSVKEAFEQGLVSLKLESIPEASTPKLLTREGVDPATMYLAGPAA